MSTGLRESLQAIGYDDYLIAEAALLIAIQWKFLANVSFNLIAL